jgi:anti-sigma regulatory factor (Ser/Thr protein kinase)
VERVVDEQDADRIRDVKSPTDQRDAWCVTVADEVEALEVTPDAEGTAASPWQPSIGCREQPRLWSYWRHTESHFQLDNDLEVISALVSYLRQQAVAMRALDEAQSLQLGIALTEALKNAMEHGNLELSSRLRESRKSRASAGSSDYDRLLEQRRHEPPYCHRRVHVTVRESPAEGRYTIRDEGPGFDKRLLLCDPRKPRNLSRPAGRGLFLIHRFVSEVVWNDAGNEITLTHRARPEGGMGVRASGRAPLCVERRQRTRENSNTLPPRQCRPSGS